MIRRLADRLVSVDLLDQAAELLQHQVDNRLQGAARAQVATRLAVIYLMNRKPDRALAALRATRIAELPNDELRNQRLLLEARALSDIGRHDVALEVIANIEGREAMRLRSDILWAGKRWREAAEQIELLYGDRWRGVRAAHRQPSAPTSCAPPSAMRWPRTRSGSMRFREQYAGKMGDGPDRRAFEVVTAPIGTERRGIPRHRPLDRGGRHARWLPARSARALPADRRVSVSTTANASCGGADQRDAIRSAQRPARRRAAPAFADGAATAQAS